MILITGEKARMLLELRRETQKHRDMTTANQREIAKLRRKERTALEATKRLERSNIIQRAMLKRRNEEVVKSQHKLKSVLGLLKRSATPNRIFKSILSGSTSPSHTRRHSRQEECRKGHFSGMAISQIMESVTYPTRLLVPETIDGMNASVDIRAQFKKQMVDKELDCSVLCRRTRKKLWEHQNLRDKLVGEQRELISERQRVVLSNFEQTKLYDAETPQYMDERVQAIDLEISELDAKMLHLEELLQRKSGNMCGTEENANENNVVDLNWENAIGILKSLDRLELEAALTYFIEDLLTLKVDKEDKICKELERENVISNLKRMVEVLRNAMLTYQQEEPQRFHKYSEEQDKLRNNVTNSQDSLDVMQTSPKSINSIRQPLEINAPISILDSVLLRKKITLDDCEDLSRKFDLVELPPISTDGRISPLRKIGMMKRDDSVGDDKRKIIFGGSDVFQRLAHAHTLASQAKVINRSSTDNNDLDDTS
jgi:kinesin family protein 4/21/27